MKRLAPAVLAALVWLGLPGGLAAQEYGPPQMYWVLAEHVKPAMLTEYEAATKEMIQLLASVPEAAGKVQFTTISGPEVGYAYVITVQGFSGMDKAWQNWEATIEAAGRDKFMAIQEKASAATDHAESFVLMLREDLSYLPETTALTAERPYRMYHYWYTLPGKEQKVEAVVKEYIALYKSKGMTTGWRVYQAVMGPDLPMYLVVETAKDPADYYTNEMKVRSALGEAAENLDKRALQYARRLETSYGWIRPDLSFPPATRTTSRD